ITDEEALSLRNTGSEENAKIRSALGRPPKDDSEVNWEASITRHLLGDIKTTNAIMINSTHEFDVFAMVHVGLFTFDWDLMPFASSDMVEKWQTSKDRMYDKVVMRRDCVWSDGTPMTAQDVAFTFRAIMNSKIPVPALRSHAVHLKDV